MKCKRSRMSEVILKVASEAQIEEESRSISIDRHYYYYWLKSMLMRIARDY